MEQQETQQLNNKDELIKKLKNENLKLKKQNIDLQKQNDNLIRFIGGEK